MCPDEVLPRLLSRLTVGFARLLSIVYERSWRSKIFLKVAKRQAQTCFFKRRGKKDPGNCTLVSGKIMEQTVLEAMPRHRKSKVTGNSQHRSTKDNKTDFFL